MDSQPKTPPTLGLVLAGGRARRMGGADKSLLRIGGRPLIERVFQTLRPESTALVVNSNAESGRFEKFHGPVVRDSVPGHPGPLAGILAGLDWAAVHAPHLAYVASAPADAPFLPADLIPRLHAARLAAGTPLACAASGGRRHPVIGLWPVALREDLRRALTEEGLRKVEAFAARHGVAVAEWPDTPVDPFFNVNTPEDAARAEALIQSGAAH